MLRNYLMVAFRVLTANKLFSFINILGLTIGLSVFILIAMFVNYELSYDKQYSDHEEIYRVERNFLDGNEISLALATNAPPVAPLLNQDFDEVKSATRILRDSLPVVIGELRLMEDSFGLVDSNVFDFFGLEFVRGDVQSALNNPTSVVLSESTAQRYFANQDPMGKSFLVSGTYPVIVTGVFKDLPKNTHLKLNVLGSIKIIENMYGVGALDNWGANSYYTYIKVQPGFEIDRLVGKFPEFLSKHLSEGANDWTSMSATKLTDIHLHSAKEMEFTTNGSMSVVIVFSAIAFCVLLIACINFMNLSTARSILRAKEVGVRKTLGASRGQLIIQFLCESIVLTTIAMVISIGILEWVLVYFTQLIERDLSLSEFANLDGAMFVIGTIIIVGGIAGSYPAFYLSRFNPINILSGQTAGSKSANYIRKILVVGQFSVSICLIIATAIVFAQMEYAKTKELGYERVNNLTSSMPRKAPLWETYLPLKEQLLTNPIIESVTLSSRIPTEELLDGSGYISADQAMVVENFKDLRDVKIDYSFFEHYKINLVAGRLFSEEHSDRNVVRPTKEKPHGSGNVVLSEKAAKAFGFLNAENAVGKIIIQPLAPKLSSTIRWTIVGVVSDIYFSSLHAEKGAILYSPIGPNDLRTLSIKYKAAAESEVIPLMNSLWSEIAPNFVLSHEFMEDRFSAMYKDEERQAIVFTTFSFLAIVIAILGLYGLVSFSTERRSKEIAIRKVMGAKVRDIVLLLTKDFTKLILVSNLIAWPLAYYLMSSWLEKFTYAVSIEAGTFIISSAIVLLISWGILTAQTSYVARGRPVRALRYE